MVDYFTNLPIEVIECILGFDILTELDLCNVSETCKNIKSIILNDQALWKIKFQNKYPRLIKLYYKHLCDGFEKINWLKECQLILKLNQQVKSELDKLVFSCYAKEYGDRVDFNSIISLASEHPLGHYLIIDRLMDIVNSSDSGKNLSQKYYAERVLMFLRQIVLTKEWNTLMQGKVEEQTLEKGAVIVAQWCQPTIDITHEHISQMLDKLADDVIEELDITTKGAHPAIKVSQDQRREWAMCNIDNNQWSYIENKQLLAAVSNVLFNKHKFSGNQESYFDPDNSFLNKVLINKEAIPMILIVLFESVTRRLGLKCEPVSFPGHFLLRWRHSYSDPANVEHYYIDVFDKGKLYSQDSCPKFNNIPSVCPMSRPTHGRASLDEVVKRMVHTLEVANRQRNSVMYRDLRLKLVLDLKHMLFPRDLNILLHLSRIYMYLNIDIKELQLKINELIHTHHPGSDIIGVGRAYHMYDMMEDYQIRLDRSISDFQVVPKNRNGTNKVVKYYVGMIMVHRCYQYECVIYGWDPECKQDEDWMTQMGVKHLARQNKQPFYHVLASDGTQRYAAEDNLKVFFDVYKIDNQNIGRYFEEYCGTYYKPNAMLSMEYPDDNIDEAFVTKLKT